MMKKIFFKKKYLFLFYIIGVLVPALSLILWTYAQDRNNLYDKNELSLKLLSEDIKMDLELYFYDFETSLKTMSQFPEIKEVRSEEELFNIFNNFISYHNGVNYILLVLEDGDSIYYSKNKDSLIGNDLKEENWYKQVKDKKEFVWADIYMEENGNLMILSALPIFNENRFIGVLSVELELDKLIEILDKPYSNSNNNIIIIDEMNNIIHHSNELQTDESIVLGIDKLNANSEFDVIEIQDNGKALAYISQIEPLNLKLISFINNSVIHREVIPILRRTLYIIVGSLIILSITFVVVYYVNIKYYQLNIVHQRLKNKSNYDELTSVYNRKAIIDFAQRLVEEKSSLVLMMLDIDYFKEINDEYGHLVGDDVLRKVAKEIKKSLRGIDKVGRYGGEEFIVILPEIELNNSISVAERIRKNIEKLTFNNVDNSITISIGIAKWNENLLNIDELVKNADKQLYRAKYNGRNQIQYEGEKA